MINLYFLSSTFRKQNILRTFQTLELSSQMEDVIFTITAELVGVMCI